jgi:hypothetical protein
MENNKLLSYIILSLTFLISGCNSATDSSKANNNGSPQTNTNQNSESSNEPSENDMQQALQEYLYTQFGNNTPYKVASVEKQSCKAEVNPPGYTCEIAMTVSTDGAKMVGGRSTSQRDIKTNTFIKQGDKWVFDPTRSRENNSVLKPQEQTSIIEVQKALPFFTETTKLPTPTSIIEIQQQALALDILGLHLGMSPDEAVKVVKDNIKSSTASVYKGTLNMGAFTSDPLLFGGQIIRNIPNETFEEVRLIFSLKPDNKLIGISRDTRFKADDSTTITTLETSLIEKYGQPTAIGKLGFEPFPPDAQRQLIWTYNSTIPVEPNTWPQGSGNACLDTMQVGFSDLAHYLYDGSLTKLPDNQVSLSNCGTWMRVEISPNRANNQLVSTMSVTFVDLKELSESYLYVMSLLQKGASDRAAAEISKAAGNKPQL